MMPPDSIVMRDDAAGHQGDPVAATSRDRAAALPTASTRRKRRRISPPMRLISIGAFLLFWEAGIRFFHVRSLILPSPASVGDALVKMFRTGEIWHHLAVSGKEMAWGGLLSLLIGIPVGVFMARVRLARKLLEPIVTIFYSSPNVAFLPIFTIWFGIGSGSKIALIFIGGVLTLIISTEAAVSKVDERLVEAARSFTASRAQVMFKVVLPGALPFILAGVRLAIGRILIMMVVAEMFGAQAGLGYLLFASGGFYQTDKVFAIVALLACMAILLSDGVRIIERRLAPWLDNG